MENVKNASRAIEVIVLPLPTLSQKYDDKVREASGCDDISR